MTITTTVQKIARASVGVLVAGMLVGLAAPAAADTPAQPVAHTTAATPLDVNLAATPERKERRKERRRDAAALRLVNQERAKAGCAPLQIVEKLQSAAIAQSADQAKRDQDGHDGANGDAEKRLGGLGYRMWAENVVQQQGAGEAVTWWLGSNRHRENMLNCAFKETGLDSERSNSGKIYWTQTFGG